MASSLARATKIGSPKEPMRTFSSDLMAEFLAQKEELDSQQGIHWPSNIYAQNPVGFFHDILGLTTWNKQTRLLESVRDHAFTACRASQKVSKTLSAMGLALWWYCSTVGGKVRMTSATQKQVENVLYTQLLELKSGAGLCFACRTLDPATKRPCPHSAMINDCRKPGRLSRTGIQAAAFDDYRIIQGFTSSTTEGLAGFSGKTQFWILDEASGIDDEIYEVVRGNLMAGGKFLAISNPTKTYGFFYELFQKKSKHFQLIHISSYDSPNVIAEREVIPGLASLESIQQLADDYGENSAIFKVRAKGEFADVSEGRIFDPITITRAIERNRAASTTGILSIGIDPSGPSGKGDESAWVALRGKKMLRCEGHLGLDDSQHLEKLREWVKDLKEPGEIPIVTIDREGAVGASVWGTIKQFAESKEHNTPFVQFRARGVRSSENAVRKPKAFKSIRDELCDAVFMWLENGGGLLNDDKLQRDLRALEWLEGVKGQTTLVDKKRLHKVLGRSPDRYDALSMAVWNCEAKTSLLTPRTTESAPSPAITQDGARSPKPTFDPFARDGGGFNFRRGR